MAKMQRGPKEAARVKLACLRMLAKLQLDPARRELISGFIDSYLRLTIEEEEQFGAELQKLHPQERESVMEIVTSWMERGLEQGRQEGRQGPEGQDGERTLLLRQLRKRLGDLDPAVEEQIKSLSADRLEELGEALFDFNSPCRPGRLAAIASLDVVVSVAAVPPASKPAAWASLCQWAIDAFCRKRAKTWYLNHSPADCGAVRCFADQPQPPSVWIMCCPGNNLGAAAERRIAVLICRETLQSIAVSLSRGEDPDSCPAFSKITIRLGAAR